MVSGKARRFRASWFDQYGNWLEYSVKTDKAFCLCCYLFREQGGSGSGNQKDAFVTEGFNSWNKTDRFALHVGEVNSFHNRAFKKCDDLLRQDQSIDVALHKQSDVQKNAYRVRLNASIDSCRWLLKKGLPFRGHNESEISIDKGNFLDLFQYTAEQNEAVYKVIGRNALGNNQMTSPKIQKDICSCFVDEVLKQILKEIGDDFFALLVDESKDISDKEQMVY